MNGKPIKFQLHDRELELHVLRLLKGAQARIAYIRNGHRQSLHLEIVDVVGDDDLDFPVMTVRHLTYFGEPHGAPFSIRLVDIIGIKVQ